MIYKNNIYDIKSILFDFIEYMHYRYDRELKLRKKKIAMDEKFYEI